MSGSNRTDSPGGKDRADAAECAGLEERNLVRLAQTGDMAAFETLYRANVARVYALCLRMAGEAAAAEELTQESFIRAWEKLPTFRGESAFSSWLHRVTVNVVLAEMRASRRRTARVETAEDIAQLAGATLETGPGSAMDLEKAIASLPPGARTVFVLYELEGYRHDEIAELTGLAPGTSKAQLHSARKLLREILKK